MKKEENPVLSILFERQKARRKKNGTFYFYYKPLEVVEGKELTLGKGKTLVCKNVKSIAMSDGTLEGEKYDPAFSHITDMYALQDRYVYGFPLILNEQSKK